MNPSFENLGVCCRAPFHQVALREKYGMVMVMVMAMVMAHPKELSFFLELLSFLQAFLVLICIIDKISTNVSVG